MLPSNIGLALGEIIACFCNEQRSGLIPKSQWNVIMAELLCNHKVEFLI